MCVLNINIHFKCLKQAKQFTKHHYELTGNVCFMSLCHLVDNFWPEVILSCVSPSSPMGCDRLILAIFDLERCIMFQKVDMVTLFCQRQLLLNSCSCINMEIMIHVGSMEIIELTVYDLSHCCLASSHFNFLICQAHVKINETTALHIFSCSGQHLRVGRCYCWLFICFLECIHV